MKAAPDAYGREIVDALNRAGAPLTPDELAARLEIKGRERRAFDAALAALERAGEIVQNRAGSLLVAKRIALVAGRIEGHPDGHGFLVPDDGSPSVFLPPAEMREVMHGDRAAVRVGGRDHRGRPVGAIVEVLERAKRRIVGRLHSEHGVLFLVPDDRRIAHDVLVPPAEAGRAKAGQVATVDLVAPPSRHAQPIGRVAEVLGHHADPGMEIEIAVRKFDLPHEFSRKATAAARAMPDTVKDEDIQGRRDLRELPFVTIDGETAKDFDDAVVCRKEGKGFRLWVAIADVSHYVHHGDALDIEARERGTSVYFPRRVIPMLPEKLSNGLCSLNPNVDRLAVVCEMAITPRGELARYEFYSAAFRSSARLTYTQVWNDLSGGRADENLQNLNAVFQVLGEARIRRGAIDFETVETRMIFDPKGKIEKIVAEARNDAHRIIEECMLAANVCAGGFLAEHAHPALYRVHDVPSAEKVAALRDFLAEIGLQLPGGEIPRPRDYAQLLEKIRKRPDFTLLQTILLRSLKQAVYSPNNLGHFGLAFDSYVHFTSPIRRYPDLLVHRAIKALLARKRYEGIDWEALGRHCSETERRADDASRDVENWLKCYYMRDHVGGVFAGTITGVVPFGLFVTLDEYFVDGLVHISELGRDYFQYDGARHMLLGERTGKRFRLADRMTVKLVRVDLDTRKIDLVPA
ncbi:MAG: ribonuclease R [Betaproteobacteria bacterium RIFCSPLOWO2_12_FULL_68_19]|nr:MAG: ribonuclease R [Betaproteobacteria bacterium RIFCSPLOWO2_12_FULL_68_19]